MEISFEDVVEIGDSEESSWWFGKCGVVRCVGGGWWVECGEVRREMMQDFEWQSVGYKLLKDRGIGAAEARRRKRRRESGDVGFMLMVVEGFEGMGVFSSMLMPLTMLVLEMCL